MEGEKHNVVVNNDELEELIPPPLITNGQKNIVKIPNEIIQDLKFDRSEKEHHINEVHGELKDTYIMMCAHVRRGVELGKEFARIKESIRLIKLTLSNAINSKYLTIFSGERKEFITPGEANNSPEDMIELLDAQIQHLSIELFENCCRMKEIVIESENIDALLITLIGRTMELNGDLVHDEHDLALILLYLTRAINKRDGVPKRFEDEDKQVEYEELVIPKKTNDIKSKIEVLTEYIQGKQLRLDELFEKLDSKFTIMCEHAKRGKELEKELARNMTNLTVVKHALSKVQNACAQAVVGDGFSAINTFCTASQSKYFNINENVNKECIEPKETDNSEDTIKVFDEKITRLCLQLSEKCHRQEEIFTELNSLQSDLGPPLDIVIDLMDLLDFCGARFDKLRAKFNAGLLKS